MKEYGEGRGADKTKCFLIWKRTNLSHADLAESMMDEDVLKWFGLV